MQLLRRAEIVSRQQKADQSRLAQVSALSQALNDGTKQLNLLKEQTRIAQNALDTVLSDADKKYKSHIRILENSVRVLQKKIDEGLLPLEIKEQEIISRERALEDFECLLDEKAQEIDKQRIDLDRRLDRVTVREVDQEEVSILLDTWRENLANDQNGMAKREKELKREIDAFTKEHQKKLQIIEEREKKVSDMQSIVIAEQSALQDQKSHLDKQLKKIRDERAKLSALYKEMKKKGYAK